MRPGDEPGVRSPIPGQGRFQPALGGNPTRADRPTWTDRPNRAENDPPDDATAWYTAGWERLARRAYPDAVRCFREYLSRAQVSAGPAGQADLRRRAEVHGATAVALLAAAPANPQVAAVTDHLLAARTTVLGPVLAAVVRQDHYHAARVEPPAALSVIADRADFDRLTRDDLTLLTEHLAPTDTDAWRLLRHRARQVGVPLRDFRPAAAPLIDQPATRPTGPAGSGAPSAGPSTAPGRAPEADGGSDGPTPPRVRRQSGTDTGATRTLLAGGFGLLLLAVLSFAAVGDPALASCLAVLSFAAGCGLLTSGLRAASRRTTGGRRDRDGRRDAGGAGRWIRGGGVRRRRPDPDRHAPPPPRRPR
ncbi:hypothetical protein O7627_25965 [Solwaraspora sp. WMMD1047]|uniref:hypothetical protein n=1 Tax=Solwaraspora sp. WMMD1047 TaxID=3016102 RepID=UPI0024180E68|nr:hypothetical protein [Solwaraspora sp. WMMD1047]MDG4832729.1 hypothetical protein [Solwaraspora sp. WMMD1047]